MIFTVSLFLIVIVLLLYLDSRKPEGYPPGPKWWPILGCAMEVSRLRKETGYLCKTFSFLCEKYGPVIGLRIGSDRLVIVNDYNSAISMLTNTDCDGRPTSLLYKARTWGVRRGLLVVDGQLWVEQRRFILRCLKDIGYGRTSMVKIVENEALELVKYFEKLIQEEENNNIMINDDDKIHQMIDNEREIFKLNVMNKCNTDIKLNDRNNFQEKLNIQTNDYKSKNTLNPRQVIISMESAFDVAVLNTLWRMMAGKRFNPDDEGLTNLKNFFNKVFLEIDIIGAPFSHFPFLRFIAPKLSGYQAFVDVHRQLWSFLDNELNDHKNTFNPNDLRDLIDVYLSVLKSKKCNETFSEFQLLAICVDFFVAGTETTSKTLSFGFLYLILFPDVQRKAHEEIDNVIGREHLPTLDDRPRLTYINAIVLESLRMFVARSFNIPHRASKDTYIMGHRIPKDTMIIVNFNKLVMNDSWSDPEEFKPERFIDKNGKIFVHDQFFPFSLGRRRCLGETLAKSNLFIIIATLLQRFTFSVVPGEQKPSTLNIVDGLTASLKPFRVLVTART